MKRNMELIRKILFAIEEKHVDVAIYGLQIDGYDMKEVAYHCDIMYQAGLLKYYKGEFGGNELQFFQVGGLTWGGQDYLELIRNKEIWVKTNKEIEDKKLPKTIEFIAKVAGKFTGAAISEMNS